MKTRTNVMAWMGVGMALVAFALALPMGAAAPPAALVGTGYLATVLGCATCLGAGVMAATTGTWLAYLLWSPAAFTASLACVGVCAAALAS